MTDVKLSKPELVGVSPTVIAFFMIIVTLFVPLGFYTSNLIVLLDWYIGPSYYGLIWAYGTTIFYEWYTSFYLLSPSFMKLAFSLSIFNLLYIVQIVRYYQGKTSKRRVLQIGVISLIFPEIFAFLSSVLFLPIYMIGFVLPVPVQFIVGLIFLYKIPGPKLETNPLE
ncbi:MAG: hypothetical protein ACFFEK_02130 [Candidatus Thorarchaeota archaeon]